MGRFLSPDAYVQAPEYTQSVNRYSYCLNNPLKYTDNDGESWKSFIQRVNNRFDKHIGNWLFDHGITSVSVGYSSADGFMGVGVGINNHQEIVAGYGTQSGHFGFGTSYSSPYSIGYNYNAPEEGAERAMKKAVSGEGNTLYAVGMGINAARFIAGAGEYSNVINGSWRGANGKWYPTTWWGNQWTGTRSTVMSRAGAFKLASRGFFVVGTGISLFQGGDALLNGNYAEAAKSGLDIGMGAFATFGGPSGWIIGGGYFLLDAIGAFERPMITTPYVPPMYAIPDNTHVSRPAVYPWP